VGKEKYMLVRISSGVEEIPVKYFKDLKSKEACLLFSANTLNFLNYC